MSRAILLIKKMGGTLYDIYQKSTATDPDTGADIVEYAKANSILAWIQPTSAGSGRKGIVLQDSASGDSITADFFMFHEKPVNEFDRIQYLGSWYEIRAIEPWNASFMNFYKSYLVKVDNEDYRSEEGSL